MIYILFGPSESGKTTLLEQVYKEFGEKAIHKKGGLHVPAESMTV